MPKEEKEEAAEEEEGFEVEEAVQAYHQHGRFYQAEFPAVDENVIVQVRKIDDKMGAYVSLLEYDGREGMINLSEISKRRIRSMLKILRIGSTEVCMVVSVDEDKGYINLSKKRVADEDKAPKQEQFAKAKAVHGMMQHVAKTNNIPVEELCKKVSWPLDEKYSSAYDAFKQHTNEEINIWDDLDFTQPGEDLSAMAAKLKEDIEVNLRRRLIQSMARIQAKVEVSCSEYAGIDAVKEALLEGFKASKEDCQVNIKLIAHPLFALTCMCREKEYGVNVLNSAMGGIKEKIEATSGQFVVVSAPSIKTPGNEPPPSPSESGDESEEDQDGMGDLDEDQMKALDKIKVEESDGEDEEKDKK